MKTACRAATDLEITKRVHERPLPRIETVDLRSEFNRSTSIPNSKSPELRTDASPSRTKAAYRLISHRLAEALCDNYRKSRQSLIFLNRRGFSNFLQCTLRSE